MQDPEALRSAISGDPRLQALVSSNPGMGDLLRPERLSQMLEAIKDPSLVLSGQAMPMMGDGDLSRQRMVRGVWTAAPFMQNSYSW